MTVEIWPSEVDDSKLFWEVQFFGHGKGSPGSLGTIGVNEALVRSKLDCVVVTGALLVSEFPTVVGLTPRIVVEGHIPGNENGLVN